ncbi:DUF6157 family protein [Dawidia soli]|uniref:Uncharacterized protein n=1 Tax=Dawidia soli TaxID=2782352 RepID=A0AAP2D8U1_9BACT|nr:DUF6157 family protein [Dawidia soli]MBT1687077.1 hypothetical protein [Dawidia soli]
MKVHTTNYIDTFIEVADDTKASSGTQPPSKGDKKTVAEMQYALLARNPYKYTSDDILFRVYAERNDISKEEQKAAREQFFSKGQACLRASPLTKTYGFGAHSNSEGKVAIYGVETPEYEKFLKDAKTKKVKAMRSAR